MTENVPTCENIERVVVLTVDALRFDCSEPYREVFPDGAWFKGTSQATFTPASHASMFTGLNPPRTGVTYFGDALQHDNMLTNVENAVSTSVMTHSENQPHPDHDRGIGFLPIEDAKLLDAGYKWLRQDNDVRETIVDAIGDHNLTFLHDWEVQSSKLYVDENWEGSLADMELLETRGDALQKNIEGYDSAINISAAIAEDLLAILQTHGLYENTLFVVWGDHGQGFGHDPLHATGHGNAPTESTCRVPIGFCSPQFEETTLDEETNARGIDIYPTLMALMDEAGIPHEEPSHEVEGVDLTSFDGSLYGYSISTNLQRRGVGDAMTNTSHIYLKDDHQTLLEATEADSGHTISVPSNDDFIASTLDEQRKRVRSERTTLVEKESPDEEHLRDMGYL